MDSAEIGWQITWNHPPSQRSLTACASNVKLQRFREFERTGYLTLSTTHMIPLLLPRRLKCVVARRSPNKDAEAEKPNAIPRNSATVLQCLQDVYSDSLLAHWVQHAQRKCIHCTTGVRHQNYYDLLLLLLLMLMLSVAAITHTTIMTKPMQTNRTPRSKYKTTGTSTDLQSTATLTL